MEPDGICHISGFTFVLTLNHFVPNCTVIGQIRLVFSDAWKNHVEHTLRAFSHFDILIKLRSPKIEFWYLVIFVLYLQFDQICSEQMITDPRSALRGPEDFAHSSSRYLSPRQQHQYQHLKKRD